MKTLEEILTEGRKQLETRDAELAKAHNAQLAKEREQRQKKESAIRLAVGEALGESLVEYVRFEEGNLSGSEGCYPLRVPGCVDVMIGVYVGTIVVQVNEEVLVPGLDVAEPLISDGEVWEGYAKLTAYGRRVMLAEPVTLKVTEIGLALALAEERWQLLQTAEKANAEKVEALLKDLEEKGSVKKVEELTYAPVDEGGNLINMGELIKLVRGVTAEVIAERSL